MNLYLVTRTDAFQYDEFTAFVLAAETPEAAKDLAETRGGGYWTSRDNVAVELIGYAVATSPEIILDYFNAG